MVSVEKFYRLLPIMKLVETTKVIQKSLQRFLNLRKFKEPVNDNVENWDKSKTYISKIIENK